MSGAANHEAGSGAGCQQRVDASRRRPKGRRHMVTVVDKLLEPGGGVGVALAVAGVRQGRAATSSTPNCRRSALATRGPTNGIVNHLFVVVLLKTFAI
uniref:Uncharacterized protein n=1 Tax=Setaria viridis TaxID=4556 RepID=A0A4U6V4D3_SETVI|nr:hypothetical protein SEVIR_4G138501v2 [Setaria viridis]